MKCPAYFILDGLDEEYVEDKVEELDPPYNEQVQKILKQHIAAATWVMADGTMGVAYAFEEQGQIIFGGLSHYRGRFSLRMALDCCNRVLNKLPRWRDVYTCVRKDNLSTLLTLPHLGFKMYSRPEEDEIFLFVKQGARD